MNMFFRNLLLALCLSAAFVPSATALTSETSDDIIARYSDAVPQLWGEHLSGIVSSFVPHGNELVLTLDACGSLRGSGYDAGIIEFLRRERIPATLFINARWKVANPQIFADLAADPLFEIGNHGLQHRPCAVTHRAIYGINATGSVRQTVSEVADAEHALYSMQLPSAMPRYFRSGTAYYDDVAVHIIHDLGYQIIGYTLAADGGATYEASKIHHLITTAHPGSILLLHFNHPEAHSRQGLISALTELKARGWKIIPLREALQRKI